MKRKEIIKTRMIGIRVTEEEHAMVEEEAKKNGFGSMSGFLLWLVHKFKTK